MSDFGLTLDQVRQYFELRLHCQQIGTRREMSVKCPFHDGRTASMNINLDRGVWHCHACDICGRIADSRLLTGGKVTAAQFATLPEARRSVEAAWSK